MAQENGSAIVAVLILIILVLGLGVSVLNLSQSDLNRNQFTEEKLSSFYLAEAGIEELRSKLELSDNLGTDKFKISYPQLPNSSNQGFVQISSDSLTQGNYILKAKKIAGGSYKVRSIGKYKDKESIIEVVISDLRNYFQEQVDKHSYNVVGDIKKFPWQDSKKHDNPKHNANDFKNSASLKRNDLQNLFNFGFYKNHAQYHRASPPGVDSDDEYCQGRAWLNQGDDSLELGETRFQNYFDSNNSGPGAVNPWQPENMDQLSGVNYVETDGDFHWELEAEDIQATSDKPAVVVIGRNQDGEVGKNAKISIDIEGDERKLDNIYFVVEGDIEINSGGSGVKTGKDTFVYATGDITGSIRKNNWNGVMAAKGDINLNSPGANIQGKPYYNPQEKRINWTALTVDGEAWGSGAKFYRHITAWQQVK